MIAEVNGIRLFYEKSGEGRPLILVHGNGEDHTIFDEAVRELKKDYCCYAVDSRCHGQSEDTRELHYRDMATDMIALITLLDLRDVIFYGFSDGGIIGLMAAARCERITTLIVSGANTSPKAVGLGLRLIGRGLYLLKRDKKFKLMLEEPDISDEELRMIRASTLVLAGSRDLIPERETRHIAEAIPGAELQILKGEDHGSYIVHSTKIAELIRGFARTSREEREA